MNSEGVLLAQAQQNFRLKITVPQWNSTNIVEMYKNGKLIKGWILNRGDVSQPFIGTINASISETKNFYVTFIARGQKTLPNFLTGTDWELPFNMTRNYYVLKTSR